jgi:predicted transposase YbfD/YdcC
LGPDLLELAMPQPGNFELFEKNGSPRGRQDSEDQAQDRTFAAAALTHDYETIERFHQERDTLENFLVIELEMDIAQLDDRWRRRFFDHVGENTV